MASLVAIDLALSDAFVDAICAIRDHGDAVCVLDQRLDAAGRQAQLRRYRPTAVVGPDGETVPLDAGIGVEAGDGLVMETSGTSGRPKAAVLTWDAIDASSKISSEALQIDPDRHTWLACLPPAHIGGLSVITRAMWRGTGLVTMQAFDAQKAEALALEGSVTHTSLVTTALARLNPAAFEAILLGGAAPPLRRGDNVIATYGMTETGSGIVYNGRALDGVTVVADDGELCVSSPTLLRCYRDGTDPTVALAGHTGRFLRTGDAGDVSHDGTVTVRGRIGEVIVTGGEKVHPTDVEAALGGAPKVRECAVWKRPDETWGERVVAFCVPLDRADPPSLREVVDYASNLAPWQRPKELVVVDELPRTSSGKLQRRLLS